jgi:hypothetical protein
MLLAKHAENPTLLKHFYPKNEQLYTHIPVLFKLNKMIP